MMVALVDLDNTLLAGDGDVGVLGGRLTGPVVNDRVALVASPPSMS